MRKTCGISREGLEVQDSEKECHTDKANMNPWKVQWLSGCHGVQLKAAHANIVDYPQSQNQQKIAVTVQSYSD